MKLPRVTTRHLLALVALAAMALALVAWMERRAEHFHSGGSRHLGLWMAYVPEEARAQRALYHRILAEKYEKAARTPWLDVFPDSPEPESWSQ